MTLNKFKELVRLKHLECKSSDKVEFSLSIGELADLVSQIEQIEFDKDSFRDACIEARIANATLAKNCVNKVRRLDEVG